MIFTLVIGQVCQNNMIFPCLRFVQKFLSSIFGENHMIHHVTSTLLDYLKHSHYIRTQTKETKTNSTVNKNGKKIVSCII